MSSGKTSSTLWGPLVVSGNGKGLDGIEVSVHTLPKPLQREFRHVFDEQRLKLESIQDSSAELLAIPTNQRAREDLVAVGDHVEAEKVTKRKRDFFWNLTQFTNLITAILYLVHRIDS